MRWLWLVIAIVFIYPNVIHAQDDGIRLTTSPLPVTLTVKPGQTVSTPLRVRNSTDHSEVYKVGLLGFKANGQTGRTSLFEPKPTDDYFKWVSFSEQQFTISANEWKTVTMTISPPESAAFGYYYAVTFGRADEVSTGQATLSGAAAILVLLDVDAPGASRQLHIDSFTSDKPWYEFLPVSFKTTISNSGNVHSAPYGTIYISRSGQTSTVGQLDLNPAGGNILPQSSRIFTITWDDGFPVTVADADGQHLQWPITKADHLRFGKYTAHLVAAYDNGQGRDVPLEASVDFWVIPWRLMMVGLVIGLLTLVGLLASGRSLWRLIRRNSQD